MDAKIFAMIEELPAQSCEFLLDLPELVEGKNNVRNLRRDVLQAYEKGDLEAGAIACEWESMESLTALAMLQSLPRASLVSLLSGVRVPASPSASDLTLRAIATSLHELGTLDAGEIATEWESLT